MIGKKYNKTPAQVALRYLIENRISVLPKTVHKDRMIENFNVFDFKLSVEDKEKILKLDQKESLFFSHRDPSVVEYIVGLK